MPILEFYLQFFAGAELALLCDPQSVACKDQHSEIYTKLSCIRLQSLLLLRQSSYLVRISSCPLQSRNYVHGALLLGSSPNRMDTDQSVLGYHNGRDNLQTIKPLFHLIQTHPGSLYTLRKRPSAQTRYRFFLHVVSCAVSGCHWYLH